MTIVPPTIIGTRSTQGLGPSSIPGNLIWNDDGQAAFFTSRSIVILTPHILSSLPPPPSYIDPEPTLEHPSAKVAKFRKKQAVGDDDPMEGDGDEDEGGAGPSTGGVKRVRRPKNGEIGWYMNGVDVREVDRTEIYEWTDVGDEFSAILAADDLSAQAIVWSPSGLSDLGSCLLAVLTTQGQVSIYTPSGDPYTKPWVEIADMTVLTRSALKKQDAQPLSVPGMLQMRATCIQWSPAVPLKSYFGIDLSLLAIANRAGKVVLWSYGPKRKFEKALGAGVTTGWVTSMSWSSWLQVDQNTCIAKLALACSDGTVAVLHVRETASIDENGAISCKVDIVKDEKVPDKDTRAISGLTWMNDILVICRAGSITLWSASQSYEIQWTGCRRIVLSQVGNWAGANPLTSCIGLHPLSSESLLVVLAGHTHHIITNILTSPTLADPSTQLNLSVAARQIFLDHIQGDMFEDRQTAKQEPYLRSLTAWTTGWSGVGDPGVVSWVGEGVNFHNMETNPEGQRKTTLVLADMGGLVPGRKPIIDCLEDVLENPPSVIHSSPVKSLMPHSIRVIATPDQTSMCSELIDLLSSDNTNEPFQNLQEHESTSVMLRSRLWAQKELDGMRARYALARWCLERFPAEAQRLSALVGQVQGAIDGMVTDTILTWSAMSYRSNSARDLTRDIPFLRLLLSSTSSAISSAGSETIKAIVERSGGPEQGNIDFCPACGEGVSMGDANGISRCIKGHEWSRCSVTRLLITHPKYRVCSICPAISLLPPSTTSRPIAVDDIGKDTDYTRFEKKPTGKGRGGKSESGLGLVEELLEAAIVCLRCGGRWVRVF